MIKKTLVLITVLTCSISMWAQKKFDLASPNGKVKVTVKLDDKIYYDIFHSNHLLLTDNVLNLSFKGLTMLGDNPKLQKSSSRHVNQKMHPVVPLKFATVENDYNELVLRFKDNYSVAFRAYDDGIAYRFETNLKGTVEVLHETFDLGFPSSYQLHMQQPNGFKTAYEEFYSHEESINWSKAGKMALLPFMIDTRDKYKILVSEADLVDYPCLFLKGADNNRITSTFPKQPLDFGEDGDRSLKILKKADYIASTNGKREFPWRYFVITENDEQIIENTMGYKLSRPNEIEDPSWINPGQASWEWWNEASPYGEGVDFVSGFNLDTYKYYIDFAAKYGIQYIIMDEGWAMSTTDPYTPNPTVDVHEIIRYGKQKNVDVILWLTWLVVENNFDLFKTFKDWGVKGVKIDFMDRSDQWMVNYYERVIKEAAKYELLVDFHGSFKPAGLEYRYPNLISYEGVRGMEQMGGCTPDNSLFLPFMRNAVGAMDYTPGAMISMQPERYSAQRPNSGTIGTRVYQLALFVVFESGLQMLADNPTMYYRNADCTDFITQVPTTWDETKALAAELGELTVVAKRKGDKWFVGGITNNKKNERVVEFDFNFLDSNKTYTMTYFEDGINAGRQAMDYRKKSIQVKRGDRFSIKMVRNGGFAAVLE